MNRYLINTFAPISKNKRSHVRGYALAWASLLEAEILTRNDPIPQENAEFYFDHGVNAKEESTLQLIGGPQSDMVRRCEDLAAAVENGCRVIPLRWAMKDEIYHGPLSKRKTDVYSQDQLDRWRATWMNPDKAPMKMNMIFGISDGWTIGDSHVLAFADKGDGIHMVMGQTLHSVLEKGLVQWFREQESELRVIARHTRIRLSLGSVDIRHHVLRHGVKPAQMAKAYVQQAIELRKKTGMHVEICVPVPVETEDRRIPKSGFYDGTPFYGPAWGRRRWTMDFIEALKKQDPRVKLVLPPDWWYYTSPSYWEQHGMEMSSSVHVAPMQYKSQSPQLWELV